MIKNAFGFPITIGEYYAYTQKQNGIGTISIGEVIGLNNEKSKVKLKIIHRGEFVYDKPVTEVVTRPIKDTWYYANALVPVHSPEVDWS